MNEIRPIQKTQKKIRKINRDGFLFELKKNKVLL